MYEGMPQAPQPPKTPENKVTLGSAEAVAAMQRLYAKEPGSGFTDDEVHLYTRLFRSCWISEETINVKMPEQLRLDSTPVVEEWMAGVGEWKSQFSLDQLFAIDRLTPEEAAVHPLRAPAQKALAILSERLFYIEHFTNISAEQFAHIKKIRGELGKAIGLIDKNGDVDHTR